MNKAKEYGKWAAVAAAIGIAVTACVDMKDARHTQDLQKYESQVEQVLVQAKALPANQHILFEQGKAVVEGNIDRHTETEQHRASKYAQTMEIVLRCAERGLASEAALAGKYANQLTILCQTPKPAESGGPTM